MKTWICSDFRELLEYNPGAMKPVRILFAVLLLATVVTAAPPELIPPSDAQWTILCEVFTGSNHQFEAHLAKDFWTQQTNLSGFYVVHQQDQSTLYYGYYRSIADPHDHKESDRAQADRQRIQQLVDPGGQRPFVGCVFVELVPKDPPAPAEWNLVNAKGHWSLQIGVYEDDPHRKEAAVDSVKEMRAHGIEAYYYHGLTASSVCIGAWPEEAVKKEQAHANDPNQPVLVSNAPLGAGDAYLRSTGQHLQQVTPKIEIVDKNLQAMMVQYPYEAINGDMEIRDADGHLVKGATPSYLVEIPQNQQTDTDTASKDDTNTQLPPAFIPPPPPPSDSTTDGLRSVDSK
jgi:hypothetical protein